MSTEDTTMTETTRAAFTAGLRDFADFLDAHEQYPVPTRHQILLPLTTNPAVEEFATRHGLSTEADKEGNLSATLAFGPVSYLAYGYVDFEEHRAATAERDAREWADEQGLEIVAKDDARQPHGGHSNEGVLTVTTARIGWAGTTADQFDLHLFGPERTAQCDPTVRTYSSSTPGDATREPYMTLRTRAQIEATGFADMYTFCPTCTTKES